MAGSADQVGKDALASLQQTTDTDMGDNTSGSATPTPAKIKTQGSTSTTQTSGDTKPKVSRPRNRTKDTNPSSQVDDDGGKRRCVSTACIACRRRKSKCDGNLPACAACCSVYNTECIYDPNSDHRRKGVYKKDIDKLKTRNSTLEVLIQAILNYGEDDVPELIRKIRTCESLDTVAEAIIAKEAGQEDKDDDLLADVDVESMAVQPTFEGHLYGKMAELRLEDGSTRYIGGTSNLLFLSADDGMNGHMKVDADALEDDEPSLWTDVTDDDELVTHLLNMYFNWHYPYFTTLSKTLFYRDFKLGRPLGLDGRQYCTPLLVNAMLALGCHFTAWRGARANSEEAATAGDHFFKEAKRLIMENDEHEKPKLATVQALALMSVREAGCGREAKGWVYSGMSFRMACDLGLNLDSGSLTGTKDQTLDDEGVDARRITFWGCFLFDKCWSNYLGRMPQLPMSIITAPKFEVWPAEESEIWAAYTDSGFNQSHAQPSRTRAVALQISALCEISGDLMNHFYNPIDMDKTKGKQAELKKLSDIHQRLETWRRNLPPEMEPREGGLPGLLLMHMFFQLLYIHLFRPFLKYSQATSPLPANVSPRRLCTQSAAAISKLLRLYKRSHGLRQICNIAVYIAHSASTIHLLNLPDKNAKRDITHGVKHLEEIAESWPCAKRTLAILSTLSKRWNVELPEEAATVLARTDAKFGTWTGETPVRSPEPSHSMHGTPSPKPSPSAGPARIDTAQRANIVSPLSPTTATFAPAAVSQHHLIQQQSLDALSRRMSEIQHLPPSVRASEVPISIQQATAGANPNLQIGQVPSLAQFSQQQQQPPPIQTFNPLSAFPNADRFTANGASPFPTNAIASPPKGTSTRASSTSPSNMTAKHTSSPSALFGGVEQLLRDSHDWWLRDQNQLAMGFDRWPQPEGEFETMPPPQNHNPNIQRNGQWMNGTTPNAQQIANARAMGQLPNGFSQPNSRQSSLGINPNTPSQASSSNQNPNLGNGPNLGGNPNLVGFGPNLRDSNSQATTQWLDGFLSNGPQDFEGIMKYSNEEEWYR